MLNHTPLAIEMIARLRREEDMEAFRRAERIGLFREPLPGGTRAWLAARLMALAVRMDRTTAERAAQRLSPRHA